MCLFGHMYWFKAARSITKVKQYAWLVYIICTWMGTAVHLNILDCRIGKSIILLSGNLWGKKFVFLKKI